MVQGKGFEGDTPVSSADPRYWAFCAEIHVRIHLYTHGRAEPEQARLQLRLGFAVESALRVDEQYGHLGE